MLKISQISLKEFAPMNINMFLHFLRDMKYVQNRAHNFRPTPFRPRRFRPRRFRPILLG